ncbi:hypothetical protein I2F27_11425 [Acinetobacter sp. B5B]|uniref:hypothetical protein n=1 Tax=Acinetobacter baretiae TaxID=2605383 RepID=UPI0018C2CFA9|nr:hypothetical protein [Acinetobacter baretiae]MBF7683929.1 hypothetical protein [Acinetobacter baretiae]
MKDSPFPQPDFNSDVPAVLLPYQQAWIADRSPLKIGEKSRRIGLTWAEAADASLEAASDQKAGGQNTYYLGYNKDMTVEFIQACAMWSRAYGLAADSVEEGIWEDGDKHIQTYIIRFPKSGYRIEALTSRPSNLRGRQGRVILDEAAFHESLDELLKAAMALLIWGGCVRVISTHDGEDNPFNELINQIRAGKRSGSLHRTSFKEAVAQGLYQRVCMRKGEPYCKDKEAAWIKEVYDFYGSDSDEELDVIPSKGGGRWLPHSLLENRKDSTVPVIRFEAPKGWDNFDKVSEEARNADVEDYFDEHLKPLLDALPVKAKSFYGLDFARKRNACSFWPLIEQQNTKKRIPFLFEMFRVPYKQQEKFLELMVAQLPNFSKAAHDAGGNGGFLAEAMQVRYGERVEAVMLTETWYRDHTPHFKASLEDGDIENMPADLDVIEDHRAFVLMNGVARIPAQGKTNTNNKDRHGDSAIAHLLADYASKNPTAPIEFFEPKDLDKDDAIEGVFSEVGCF